MNGKAIKQLEEELALWQEAGQTPKLWWRDDDAIAVTPQLLKLQGIAAANQFPVTLAVIPSLAKSDLSDFIRSIPLFTAATHGFGHVDHSDPEVKKTELTENSSGRSSHHVIEELKKARKIMIGLFDRSASEILVPPWNRISNNVSQELSKIGFQMLSTFTDQTLNTPIRQINCHIDLMEWRPVRKGKPFNVIIEELIICLSNRRHSENTRQPIGILSHHLVHDATAWETTEKLMALISNHPQMTVVSRKELLSDAV